MNHFDAVIIGSGQAAPSLAVGLANRGQSVALIEECTRLLVPGGRLALLALNPLSPYRLR